MIRHGVHKKLVELFVENISDQLFFAIFVDAEGIGSGRSFCWMFLRNSLSTFSPSAIFRSQEERTVPSIFIYIILEESASPTGSRTVLEKNLLIDGNQGVTDHAAFAVLFIDPSSKDQNVSVTVGVYIRPYILIF